MLRHKNIERVCLYALAVMLLITILFLALASAGVIDDDTGMGYEARLFDQSRVHTIDITMDDWDSFLETCQNEEYAACTVSIDGEPQGNVAIRAKGNTSLSSVAQYGNNRYSFKIEFDQYENGKSYYGLDKLSLNNLIQDKTYLKDYMAYTLMNEMDVAAPLCSFVNITVNGEDWGVYLAVEGVEDSFLERNYGTDHGELYKPDSMSFGGGRGKGKDFNMDEFNEQFAQMNEDTVHESSAPSLPEGLNPPSMESAGSDLPSMPQGMPELPGGSMPDFSGGMPDFSGGSMPDFSGGSMPDFPGGSMPDFPGGSMPDFPGGGPDMGGRGDSDVKLQYIDDNPDSYENIWNGAKTDITENDQKRLIASLKSLSEQEKIESVVDAEAVIRYLVVHNFMCNDDSYTGMMVHNYYLYEEDGQLSMIPWDYNLALGAFGGGGMGMGSSATSTVNSPIDSPVSMGDISSRPMVAWIFDSEEYTALYHEIYAEFISEFFDSGWLAAHLRDVIAMLSPYIRQDATAFYTYEEFRTGTDALLEFCDLRAQSVVGQLSGEIPATTVEQRTSSSSLIDASHLSLSDMGEFNMGGGGFPDMPTGGFPGGSSSDPDDQAKPEKRRSKTALDTDSNGSSDFPGGFPDNFSPPGMPESEAVVNPAEAWLLLALSTALLIAALILVRRSKPHQ
ncbi:MAG: CotH kinase family protein [Clostridia bacterium]|nr:CotH kinase family protein [Clostridia bacterium]